jgi:hypothetical protein
VKLIVRLFGEDHPILSARVEQIQGVDAEQPGHGRAVENRLCRGLAANAVMVVVVTMTVMMLRLGGGSNGADQNGNSKE